MREASAASSWRVVLSVLVVTAFVACQKETTDSHDGEQEDASSREMGKPDDKVADLPPEALDMESQSTGCPAGLFSEEVCGHGEQVKVWCGTCREDELGLECVHEENKEDELVKTVCTCLRDEWSPDSIPGFRCSWQRPLAGHQTCDSSEECPTASASGGTQQKMHCIRPCQPHLMPFCAVPCEKHSDCEAGDYCGVDYVGYSTSDIRQYCMPNGIWSCESQCDIEPGVLCPCEDDHGCGGYACIAGRYGAFCSEVYTDSCDYGLEYMMHADFEAAVCVDRTIKLCMPCVQDSDCRLSWAPNVDHGDKCVIYGNAGGYCGIDCHALWPHHGDCPSGYDCVDGQCVSSSGTCNCPPYHVELAATTNCSFSNESGACQGMRMCTEQGLSDCDALTPGPEICDGLDNDCDGEVDEGC